MKYPVRLIAEGTFREGEIEICREDLPALPSAVATRVQAIWTRELVLNPNLRNGPLLTARSVEVVDGGGRIRLHCGLSNYANFMGTTSEAVTSEFGDQHCHRAVGFLAVTHTADNRFILGVRSPKIDWGTLRHVVPAGRLRPDQLDPFTGVRKEFEEELGLRSEHITSLVCCGVVADLTYGRLNFEFCFLATTYLMAREVIEYAKGAKSANEHCQLEPFPWQPGFVRELLLADPEGYVPTGWAGVGLCLRQSHDKDSFPDWEPAHRTYEEHMGRRLPMIKK